MAKPKMIYELLFYPVKDIFFNEGQITGLPKNPRIIKDRNLDKMKQSVLDDPEMLQLNEIKTFLYNGEMIAICGNQRLQALQALGVENTWIKVLSPDTTVEKLKSYAIKDNVSFGEWDWENLANDEWGESFLEHTGLDVPKFEMPEDISEPEESKTVTPDSELTTCPKCNFVWKAK